MGQYTGGYWLRVEEKLEWFCERDIEKTKKKNVKIAVIKPMVKIV